MTLSFYIKDTDILDNYAATTLLIDGLPYPTLEHAYQSLKCTDPAGKEAIRNAPTPAQAKHLANNVYGQHKDPTWDKVKVERMKFLMTQKFEQHSEVQKTLQQSKPHTIEEASPYDNFWGTGTEGTGKNMIGKLWMEIRTEHFPD